MANNVLFKTSLIKGPQGDRGEAGVADAVPVDGILAFDGTTIPEGYEETENPVGDLAADVAQNTSNIATLTNNVAQNTSNITTLNNKVTQNTSDIATQTARIDNIANLPSGSTSGDAELADIRVGYNGVTYTDAGTAVRTCDEILQKSIDSINGSLFDYRAMPVICNQSVVAAQNLRKYWDFNFVQGKSYKVVITVNNYPSSDYTGGIRHIDVLTTNAQDWSSVDDISGEIYTPALQTYTFTFTASANASMLYLYSISGAGNVNISIDIYTTSIDNIKNSITQNVNLEQIRADYDNLKINELYNNNSEIVAEYSDVAFAIGDISLSTGDNITSTTVLRENTPTGKTYNKRYIIPSGWKLNNIVYYNGTTFDTYAHGYVIGQSNIINANFVKTSGYSDQNCRATFVKSDGSAITEEDYNSFVASVKVYYIFDNVVPEYYPTIEKVITFYTGNQIQCAAMVNDIMWQSTSSADDHEGYYGKIFKFNPNVAEPVEYTEASPEVTVAYHNLGHSGIKGYNKYSDIGISEGVFDSNNCIIIIKNLSRKTDVMISDPDVIHIELDGHFFFGTTYNTIMGVDDNGVVKRYLIGYGDRDYSGVTGGYGTYISGCEDNEFNGTLKLIDTYYLEYTTTRQPQEYFLYEGSIGLLTGLTDSGIDVYTKQGLYYKKNKEVSLYNYASDGHFKEEPECYLEYKGNKYLNTWYKYGPTQFFVYKIGE